MSARRGGRGESVRILGAPPHFTLSLSACVCDADGGIKRGSQNNYTHARVNIWAMFSNDNYTGIRLNCAGDLLFHLRPGALPRAS